MAESEYQFFVGVDWGSETHVVFDGVEVLKEGFFDSCGKHRVAILVALARPGDDLVPREGDHRRAHWMYGSGQVSIAFEIAQCLCQYPLRNIAYPASQFVKAALAITKTQEYKHAPLVADAIEHVAHRAVCKVLRRKCGYFSHTSLPTSA